MKIQVWVCAGLLAGGLAAGTQVWATGDGEDVPVYSPALAKLNDVLRKARIENIALDKAELLVTEGASRDFATTIIANNRTHLLSSQFVEDDPRRGRPANTITYLVDQSDGSALSWKTAPGGAIVQLSNAVTEPELDTSMAAWATQGCNGPAVTKIADSGADPDLVDGLVLGLRRQLGTTVADITHAGWLPREFFDGLAPNGSASILGVTFTFIFVDDNDNPTDVDRNGRADVAFREIYYNQRFPWGTGGNPSNIDIQSVAIHEAGHAFGLNHFGMVFLTETGAIQFSPKAIMNAVYVFEDRTIYGTDNASFCDIWANSF
jgi:hypothetical protein